MRPFLALALALSLFTAFASPSRAQTASGDRPGKIVVGTMRIPPFVLHSDDGIWSGLSIDLWKQIAVEMKTDTEFRAFDYDVDGLLHAVERKEVDVALAAIPMTPVEESRFDFSHPYYTAGLAIAVREEPSSGALGVITSVFTPQVLGTIGGLVAILIFAGTLMWLLERRRNANFGPHPARGVGDGVWWAAVTMTTTGYGDKVPASAAGRALGIVWMFSSIFLIALFSATLASSLVVDRLKTRIAGPDDLPGARIAIISGSAGERWLESEGLRGRRYPFVIQATKALQRGDVDALIYERAILGHMMKHYGWEEIEILPHTLAVRLCDRHPHRQPGHRIRKSRGAEDSFARRLAASGGALHRRRRAGHVGQTMRTPSRPDRCRRPVILAWLPCRPAQSTPVKAILHNGEGAMRPFAALTLAIALTSATILPVSAQEVAGTPAVTGAGSTFAYPLISRWSKGYQRWVAGGAEIPAADGGLDDPPAGPVLDYEPVGSLAGMMRVTDGAVDFGATEMPLKSEELRKRGLVQFPMVIGGIVAVVNLDGVAPGQMKLTGALLADIFLGKIKNWSDQALKALNPGLQLPDAEIVVVRRSDGSGTTFNFTNYLAKISPEWQEKVGSDLIVQWPLGEEAKGNKGVAEKVAATKNAIGYVEYTQAVKSNLSFASIQNRDGTFVTPEAASFQAAAAGADWDQGSDFNLLLIDAAGKDAYPMVASVFLLMRDQATANRTRATLDLFAWAFDHGARDAAAIGYVPLPNALVAEIKDYWAKQLQPGS